MPVCLLPRRYTRVSGTGPAKLDSGSLSEWLTHTLPPWREAAQAKGTVTLSAGVEEQEVWIKVSDTGPGIFPEEQSRVFAPFFRSQPGRRFPQGMGLGLSIAYALAAAHGGRLELESSPGLGSGFTVWLPLDAREV